MKKIMKSQKGFTLIELVLVITVLGILAVAALPSFIDISSDAQDAAGSGVVSGVQAGLSLQKALSEVASPGAGIFPATLDTAGAHACDTATPCFDNVLQTPVTDGAWVKTAATTYTYDGHTYTYTGGGTGTATFTE